MSSLEGTQAGFESICTSHIHKIKNHQSKWGRGGTIHCLAVRECFSGSNREQGQR